jgi:hypothetical protein
VVVGGGGGSPGGRNGRRSRPGGLRRGRGCALDGPEHSRRTCHNCRSLLSAERVLRPVRKQGGGGFLLRSRRTCGVRGRTHGAAAARRRAVADAAARRAQGRLVQPAAGRLRALVRCTCARAARVACTALPCSWGPAPAPASRSSASRCVVT